MMQARQRSKRPPFADVSGKRDYNALYRAAFDFHKAHTTLTPFDLRTAAMDAEMVAAAHNYDPFLYDILSVICNELERQNDVLRTSHQEA